MNIDWLLQYIKDLLINPVNEELTDFYKDLTDFYKDLTEFCSKLRIVWLLQ